MVIAPKIEKQFYRPDEICTIMDIDRSTFYRLANQVNCPLPAVKLNGSDNGHLRIPKAEFENWLEVCRKDPLNE